MVKTIATAIPVQIIPCSREMDKSKHSDKKKEIFNQERKALYKETGRRYCTYTTDIEHLSFQNLVERGEGFLDIWRGLK